jgi:hypothetical protein
MGYWARGVGTQRWQGGTEMDSGECSHLAYAFVDVGT